MPRGRPPLGAELVQRLQGSNPAKRRLEAILQTLAGQVTIPEACEQLGINPSRFHALRTQAIQQWLVDLEPRPAGRPPHAVGAEQARISELEGQVQDLQIELRAAQIRQEVALLMPHLLNRRRRGGAPESRGEKPGRRQRPAKPADPTRPAPRPRPATDP